jgi:NAD(P)-dependent dehydrogenase (short-subunit alcohol dehydrogenase family)
VAAPGAIATDFAGGAVRDTKELNDQFANMIALGRVGLPEDIGAAVTAILDDGAAWMTAQRIEVSGGQTI